MRQRSWKNSSWQDSVRHNSLGLTFLALFGLAVVGQAFVGHASFNETLVADGLPPVPFSRYLTSSEFAVDVAENWQSEYLQFFLYITLTVWLVQRGSPESKALGRAGAESDSDQRVAGHARPETPRWARRPGWRLAVYSRSLGLVMAVVFVLSWLAQAVTGRIAYNAAQLRQLQDPVSFGGYVTGADFWDRTLQNWQSEFLAIASMAILAIYLRQRGSPESKPVGAAHEQTGVTG